MISKRYKTGTRKPSKSEPDHRDKREREEFLKLINDWADAERAYVSTVIKFPIGSKQEQEVLRQMENLRSKVITNLPIIEDRMHKG